MNTRIVTFADLESGLWGAAWGGALVLGVGTDAAQTVRDAAIAGDAGQWRIASEPGDLLVAAEQTAEESDQLCRVTGTIRLAGADVSVDCEGRRAEATLGRFGSVRDLSAWFGTGEGFALRAVRDAKAAGNERDQIVAVVFDGGQLVPVADPRLSTTYTAAGRPSQAGVELWLEAPDGEQYPRRAAGEAVGGGTLAQLDDALHLDAGLFRWHSRGHDGAGVYLLVTQR
jgi:hypothetical protein